ncbi:MAG: hypothetical protein AB1393_00690 [Candidatus Edwardsbacteria bacterium]
MKICVNLWLNILLLSLTDKTPTFSLEFLRERIYIKVSEGELCVEGKYYFFNSTNQKIKVPIFYPFAIDESHLFPYEIKVYEKGFWGNKTVPIQKEERGISWILQIEEKKTKQIHVCYSQKIRKKEARYILITTKTWGKPLKEAQFIIEIPTKFKEISISYLPDRVVRKKRISFYYIRRDNFMPDRDLIIRWE